MTKSSRKVTDGGLAATNVAYALSEVATIFPITPVAEMGEVADQWQAGGRTTLFGRPLRICELESELGAAGAAHGALCGGALATTFTNSQGLLLMIPNMYKIAGELLPAVFHVASRSLASHALSIFGDHQDIMAVRHTGFAMLSSASVQECQDLAIVAHLAALEGSVPFVHCFDGWRTSSEMQTIDQIDPEAIRPLINREALADFRRRAMNPEHPDMRGTAQGPDVYFQNREASNRFYDALPAIVESYMKRVGELTGRNHSLFEYTGAADAERVIVALGSATEVVAEAVRALTARGEKVGVVAVKLFRPFDADRFIAALPPTVRVLCTLDRTKEPGATGEPLMQEVATAVLTAGRAVRLVGGRYGLSSKQFTPTMAKAVFDMMASDSPRPRFTVGIDDDVTHLSIPIGDELSTIGEAVRQCKFYGIGADGTVGATKDLARLIGEHTPLYAQAYFDYSAKKSGGYTISELRLAPTPIRASYLIEHPDYVGCNKASYLGRYDMLADVKPGGTFVLNTAMTDAELEASLPPQVKRQIAAAELRFFAVDAERIALEAGLGSRVNMVMSAIFLKISGVMPFDEAVALLKQDIASLYGHEGEAVVARDCAAVDSAAAAVREVHYPASWTSAPDVTPLAEKACPPFVARVAMPMNRLEGDRLPVSAFDARGHIPPGTTAFEKRRVAVEIPMWLPDRCIQCTACSLVCAHAAIRPLLATQTELAGAPSTLATVPAKEAELAGMSYRIQVYPDDCVGCSLCAQVCPGKALVMTPVGDVASKERANLDFCEAHVSIKDTLLPRFTAKGSQLRKPLLEFSGACGGCGETPYVKLLTQLFGERMIIANATGCSSIWGGYMPSNPYTTLADGRGPAWGNSLFEDNAEYGFGIAVAINQRRARIADLLRKLGAGASSIGSSSTQGNPSTSYPVASTAPLSAEVREAIAVWLAVADDGERSYAAGKALVEALKPYAGLPEVDEVLAGADLLGKKSIWCIGGDGWAYDIGFAGLDHVLASGLNINMLVLDTECYSNTGGDASKATPIGAAAKYCYDGKPTNRKDLARMMMTYGNVYVANISLGGDHKHAIEALREAEAFDGPSLVVAYCPCIAHGIRKGMGSDIAEAAEAVRCGYWPLFRFNPALKAAGHNPFSLDSPQPDASLPAFLDGEDRYAALNERAPQLAAPLRAALKERCEEVYRILRGI